MNRTPHPTVSNDPALPEATHLPAVDRLRGDLLALRGQAHRYGFPATAQALDLAIEMLEVEQEGETGVVCLRADPAV